MPYDLNSNLLFGLLVESFVNLTEGTLANLVLYDVLICHDDAFIKSSIFFRLMLIRKLFIILISKIITYHRQSHLRLPFPVALATTSISRISWG